MERSRRYAGRQGPYQQPVRVVKLLIRHPCTPPPSVAMDAGGGVQQDEALSAITQEARVQPPVKRVKRSTQQLQLTLLSLCTARHDKKKTVVETIEGLGHIIRF